MPNSLAQAGAFEFWIWTAAITAASAAGFFFAARNLARARLIEDTPTAKVRSAPQGYVELVGRARPHGDQPLLAPLTRSECCWYHIKVEKKGDKSWRTVRSETSTLPFLLEDDTGSCIIEPEGAQVTPSDRAIWYGGSREPGPLEPKRSLIGGPGKGPLNTIPLNVSVFGGRYRYTEERIVADAEVYAIGEFHTSGELEHRQKAREASLGLLRDWKADQEKLLRRFDHDGDGRIDEQEWDNARSAAAHEAEVSQRSQRQELHYLGKPRVDRLPFLLSSQEEFALVRRCRWYAFGASVLFIGAGAMVVWMLKARYFG